MNAFLKCIVIVMLSLLNFNAKADDDVVIGHESGGRRGDGTLKLRFTSKGSGIEKESLEAIRTLIKNEMNAGHVARTIETSWGKEGELDICVEMKGTQEFKSYTYRSNLQQAIARVLWFNNKGSESKLTFFKVSAEEKCSFDLKEKFFGSDRGIFLQDDMEDAKLASLDCLTLPTAAEDGYQAHLYAHETIDSKANAQVKYILYQTSSRARYEPREGDFSEFGTSNTRGNVTFRYDSDQLNLAIAPTSKRTIQQGHQVYVGILEIGEKRMAVSCESGHKYGITGR